MRFSRSLALAGAILAAIGSYGVSASPAGAARSGAPSCPTQKSLPFWDGSFLANVNPMNRGTRNARIDIKTFSRNRYIGSTRSFSLANAMCVTGFTYRRPYISGRTVLFTVTYTTRTGGTSHRADVWGLLQ